MLKLHTILGNGALMVGTQPKGGLTATIPPGSYSGVKVFRAFVLGAAITAAAIGAASTASADVGLVAGVGKGGVPASPLHFLECQKGSYQASSGDCVESPDQNANGAIGKCCDGTDTHAEHRSGACSSHGGVCQWFAAAGSAGDNPDNGPVDTAPIPDFCGC